jgi:formate C-acetyltransferase
MNERIRRLRKASHEAKPYISHERAELLTDFYLENDGKYSIPVMRGLHFKYQCENKAIYIGPEELIVGERGPFPKSVSTYPELNCHSVQDLEILNSRKMTSFAVSPEAIEVHRKKIIPYWESRCMRAKVFRNIPQEWKDYYEAGAFTEFMEQRAPGHTTLDGTIYQKGMLDFKREIADSLAALDYLNDPEATDKAEELKGMDFSCDAAIIFAERHAALAEQMAREEADETRRKELLKIADVCRRVPAHAPRDLWEALQMYWFVHLGTITELNGWDAMNPGHLDQHLLPFYEKGLADGTLSTEQAKELISCLWIKFNNQPAPPKVGVTAAESGTYTDFANINLAGVRADGSDGSNAVTHLLLDIIDEMHLLQPSSNMQVSRRTPDEVLKHALRVIRNGYGFPSLFNATMSPSGNGM